MIFKLLILKDNELNQIQHYFMAILSKQNYIIFKQNRLPYLKKLEIPRIQKYTFLITPNFKSNCLTSINLWFKRQPFRHSFFPSTATLQICNSTLCWPKIRTSAIVLQHSCPFIGIEWKRVNMQLLVLFTRPIANADVHTLWSRKTRTNSSLLSTSFFHDCSKEQLVCLNGYMEKKRQAKTFRLTCCPLASFGFFKYGGIESHGIPRIIALMLGSSCSTGCLYKFCVFY